LRVDDHQGRPTVTG